MVDAYNQGADDPPVEEDGVVGSIGSLPPPPVDDVGGAIVDGVVSVDGASVDDGVIVTLEYVPLT